MALRETGVFQISHHHHIINRSIVDIQTKRLSWAGCMYLAYSSKQGEVVDLGLFFHTTCWKCAHFKENKQEELYWKDLSAPRNKTLNSIRSCLFFHTSLRQQEFRAGERGWTDSPESVYLSKQWGQHGWQQHKPPSPSYLPPYPTSRGERRILSPMTSHGLSRCICHEVWKSETVMMLVMGYGHTSTLNWIETHMLHLAVWTAVKIYAPWSQRESFHWLLKNFGSGPNCSSSAIVSC